MQEFNKTTNNILFIDAISIAANGGGATHLMNLVNNFKFNVYKFNKIHIFGSTNLLNKIPEKKYIIKVESKFLNKNLILQLFFLIFIFKKYIKKYNPTVVFSLAAHNIKCNNLITISQNLLPFDKKNIANYNYLEKLKLYFTRVNQIKAFNNSKKIIFLSEYARDMVMNYNPFLKNKSIIIPHGISFECQSNFIKNYDITEEINLLYVSSIVNYKNHLNVFLAAQSIKTKGYNIKLKFIGDSNKWGKRLLKKIEQLDSKTNILEYSQAIKNSELNILYQNSDIFIFASSCETFGIILLEAMSFGLPIICSNKSSMFELAKNGCLYFNPNDINELIKQIEDFILNKELRITIGKTAKELALKFDIETTVIKTYDTIDAFYE